MESYSKIYNTICRLCLKHDKLSKMMPLVGTNGELTLIGETVENLTKIALKGDSLPKNVCSKCKTVLSSIISFKNTCLNNDKCLKTLLNTTRQMNVSLDESKEIFCQYTMYHQYFPEKSSPSGKKEIKHSSVVNVPKKIVQKTEKNNFSNDFQNEDTDISQSDSDKIDSFLDSIERNLLSMTFSRIKEKAKPRLPVVKDLTCKVCFRKMANRSSFDYHMQRHGVCRYICDQCGKGFPVLTELTKHQITKHDQSSLFQCDHCSFQAPRRLDLIEHIRLHTGERPFTCEKCGLTFRRKAIWRNHLKCHGDKVIQCSLCPRKFYRRGDLLAHTNNIHDRVYLYLCRVCDASYAKIQTVRKHMLAKHGIAREMQGKIFRVTKNSHINMFKDSKSSSLDV